MTSCAVELSEIERGKNVVFFKFPGRESNLNGISLSQLCGGKCVLLPGIVN